MRKRKTMAQIAKEAKREAQLYFKNPYGKKKSEDADVFRIEGLKKNVSKNVRYGRRSGRGKNV